MNAQTYVPSSDYTINAAPSFRRTFLMRADFPRIVCICGSSRFTDAWQQAMLDETLAGRIVLAIGSVTKTNEDLRLTEKQKAQLDDLHIEKIDLADEILVLNVDGYIGESTQKEIDYAAQKGKTLRFLEPVSEIILRTPVVSKPMNVFGDTLTGMLAERSWQQDVKSWRAGGM